MKILHIAHISSDLCNGVCVVVPKHVMSQEEFADVMFWNISNEIIQEVDCQINVGSTQNISEIISQKGGLNLVVFHEAYRKEYLTIYRELVKYKIPYIIIPHGELAVEAQKKKWLKKFVANLLLFNRFFKKAAAIQCLSLRELENTNFGNSKFIGTNGILLPDVVKEGFNKSEQKILYIGRLDMYHKGLDLLLDAVQLIADFMREQICKVYIYGPDIKGRYDNLLRKIEENNIQDIVVLNREIVGAEKEKEILNADFFVQTSRFEGMPMGILEALSYGLPCLVTEGTTLGEIIEKADAGWYAYNTKESIAEKMKEAISFDNKEVKSYNARKLVAEKFVWNKISSETVKKYKEIWKKN